jgi:uncharacterized cupin superfamily protein
MSEWLIQRNHATALSALALEHTRVPADQQVDGAPTTGWLALGSAGTAEVGVWEMSVGAMSDTEADEVFVVLSGEATIEFLDEGRTVSIAVGDCVRLSAGMRTIWSVTAPLRKLYITLPPTS